jgi:hypothetical protein
LFYFSLARELGMPVSELLARCTSRELSEWMAFSAIENRRMSGKKDEDEPESIGGKIAAAFAPYKKGGGVN